MSGLKGGLLLCGLILSIALTAAWGSFSQLRAVQVLRIRILTASLADGARSTSATSPNSANATHSLRTGNFCPSSFGLLADTCARDFLCAKAQ
jgi:hypothetical protein